MYALKENSEEKYIILSERLNAIYELKDISVESLGINIDIVEFNKKLCSIEKLTTQKLKSYVKVN